MTGPFGRQGPADTLRQHCPQMTRRRCSISRADFCYEIMPSDRTGTPAYYQMDRVAGKGKGKGAGQGGRRGGSLRHTTKTTMTWQQKIPELPAGTGSSEKKLAKLSDTCSVRADGLCIGSPRLVGGM